MSNNATTTHTTHSGGIGLFGAMFIVFLVLKLTGYISWSWWWVTAPLWGGFLFGVAMMILFVLIGLLVVGIGHLLDNRKRATVRKHKEQMRLRRRS